MSEIRTCNICQKPIDPEKDGNYFNHKRCLRKHAKYLPPDEWSSYSFLEPEERGDRMWKLFKLPFPFYKAKNMSSSALYEHMRITT